MATLGKLEYLISVNKSELSSGLSSAEKTVKNFGNNMSSWAVAKGQVLGRLIEQAGRATINFVKQSVSESRTFDKSMSQVAATLGKSVNEIQDLSKFARKMGAETAFTAQEAAQGLNYMALAGYDTQKSMQMLPKVLNLAAAGNMDLARASDMVTDAQSALGLSIEGTDAMIDQMALAASKTNTSVEQLGDAILTVGGTAKQLKGGTEELAVVLGLLADNGIKGSEGGTALRNVLMRLTAPTDKAAKQLKALGVDAFDSQGSLRSLQDIFLDFNDVMSDKTQQERAAAFSEIFNVRDLKSVEALIGTSADRWTELYQAMAGYKGSAARMAETQLDNLQGDVTKFNSALGEAKLTIVEGLTPSLRKFTQAGTRFVQRITEAFKKNGFTGALKEANVMFSTLITNLKNSDSPVLQKLGGALEFVKNIGGEVWDLITNFPDKIKEWKEADSPGLNALATVLEGARDAVDTVIVAFNEGIPAAIEHLNGIDTPLSNLAAGALQTLYDVCSFFVENVGLEGTITGIAGAFGLFKSIQISASVLTFITKLQALANLKNLKQVANILNGGNAPTVPTGTETPTPVPTEGGGWKTFLAGFGKLGLTFGTMLAPAAIAGLVRNLIPKQFQLGETEHVTSANYTQDEVNSLREWVDLQNEMYRLNEKGMSITGLDAEDERRLEAVSKRLEKITPDVQQSEVWGKYWEYLVANDIMPQFEELPTKILDEMGAVPVEFDAKTEMVTSAVKQLDLSAPVTLTPVFSFGGSVGSAGGSGGGVGGGGAVDYWSQFTRPSINAKGDWYVPRDNYPMLAHRGELLLNQSQARRYRDDETGGGVANIPAIVARSVKESMRRVNFMLNGDKVADFTWKPTNKNIKAQSYSKVRAYGG